MDERVAYLPWAILSGTHVYVTRPVNLLHNSEIIYRKVQGSRTQITLSNVNLTPLSLNELFLS